MKKPAYYEQKILAEKFGSHLKGLGQHPLRRQRGLRGTVLGPASDGRKLSREEIEEIEKSMRARGEL